MELDGVRRGSSGNGVVVDCVCESTDCCQDPEFDNPSICCLDDLGDRSEDLLIDVLTGLCHIPE